MSWMSDMRTVRTLLALAVICVTLGAALSAQAEDLTDRLELVGEQYASAYVSPFITAFGADMNSGLYTTAAIPKTRLTVSVGLRLMASRISEDDQSFTRSFETTLDEAWGVNPGDTGYGESGVIVMDGPTVFGDEDTEGTVTAFYNGIPVYQQEALAGLVDTRWVPLASPEVSVGGLLGLRATLRWLPSMDIGDYGDIDYMGFGLQYSVNNVVPTLPVDVMVGFFHQSLDIGDIIDSSADSYFAVASRSFVVATIYGGVAVESSSMDVHYTQEGSGTDVDFSIDGQQEARLTLGATLNILSKVNVEAGFGDLTTFSASLLFGF